MAERDAKHVFAKAMRIVDLMLSGFSLNGIKGLVAMENDGLLAVKNTGISNQAVVALVIQLASKHPEAFSHALELLEEKETFQGETVH